MEYYSAIKKNKIPAFFATWMDLETIMLREVSHTMRHQHPMLPLTWWNLKKEQTELLCRTDADSQTLKNLWSLEETVWGVGDVPEIWDGNPVNLDYYDHYTTTNVINSFE